MSHTPHKFRNHILNPDTEILILGTFNPGIPNGPIFFYGTAKNHLWQLLPGCWGMPSLKPSLEEQNPSTIQEFMIARKIDFVDLIDEVDVPLDERKNRKDTYIDSRVTIWKDVVGLMNQLPKLKAVYFTRKTFGGIPNIHKRILNIQNNCQKNGIRFCLLNTPARYVNVRKQQEWVATIVNQTTCLQTSS